MSDYVPADLWPRILVRLPTKSLGRFRCVCTTWNMLITSARFISSHLAATTTNRSNPRVLVVRTIRRSFNLYQDISFTSQPERIPFPLASAYDAFVVVGVCHGVICLSFYSIITKSSTVILWNPNICRYVRVPDLQNSIVGYNIRDGDPVLGFGFDPITKDLKVVSLLRTRFISPADVIDSSMAYVFSSREGRWRAVVNNILPVSYRFGDQGSASFLNGSIHWSRLDQVSGKWKVLVFYCGSEQFSTFNPPASLTNPPTTHLQIELKAFKGKLSIYECGFCQGSEFQGINVWVMNEYGVDESWSKSLTIPFLEGWTSCGRVLMAREEDGAEIILNDDGLLTMFDIDTGRRRRSGIGSRNDFENFYVGTLEPSLLLMDVEGSLPCGGAISI